MTESIIVTHTREAEIEILSELIPITSNGDFFVTAPMSSEENYSVDILKRNYHTAINKEIRISHIPPEKDINSYMGVVADVWWSYAENVPYCKLKINSDTPAQNKIREILIEDNGKPFDDRRYKGVSIGVIEHFIVETKEVTKIEVREISLAKNPACSFCLVRALTNFENENIETEVSLLTEDIKTVETDQFSAVTKLFEKRITELESSHIQKNQVIEEYTAKISTFEIRITELETEKNELEAKLTEAEKLITISKTLPLRIKIARLENMDIDSKAGKGRIKELEELTLNQLALFLKGAERRATISNYGLEVDSVNSSPQFGGPSNEMALGNPVGYTMIPDDDHNLMNNVRTKGFGGR